MKILSVLFLILGVAVVCAAQTVTESASKQIESAAPELLSRAHEAGLAVVLIENCAVTWRRDFGLADTARNKPVDRSTLFQFGSMSKPITAWAIMTLVEDGKIDLDAPVNKYLKSWKLKSTEFDPNEVTVRRVLHHSAGLSIPSVSGVDFGTSLPSLVDELNGAGPSKTALTITEKPGTKFSYSGGGYALLQLLVEDVTGTSFPAYVRKKIFKPLGMTTATFAPDQKTLSSTATPYNKEGQALAFRVFSAEGAAGLYATVDDYAKFVLAQCATDNKVLKPATLQSMFLGDAVTPRYGLGYELLPKLTDNPIISHSGSNLGWKANFMIFPTEGVGIVVATNSDVGEARKKVLSIWRDAVVAKYKPAPKP
ncbi:MAG TPA: serine hydrolase domain-containing protein [Pyrinomonadaceae bacterium]|nr:serine hydrolase domain-containing protein [Pyrinomonadaceae bacterium]